MELTTYSSFEEYQRQSNEILINDLRSTGDYLEIENDEYFNRIED